jgi:hypothetical protein
MTVSDQPEMDYDTALAGLVEGAEREVALFNKLAEIGRDFAGATNDIEQRQNALAALEAIIKHCLAADVPSDAIVTMNALFADIENLNEGREVIS